jgi:hypothetical protein
MAQLTNDDRRRILLFLQDAGFVLLDVDTDKETATVSLLGPDHRGFHIETDYGAL